MKKFLKRFKYAIAGLRNGFVEDSSIRLQYILALLTGVILFIFFDLNRAQWLFIIIAIALVIAFEYLNSALEQVVDMIVSEYDERAKRVKDYAAACVLILCVLALVIAAIVLL